MSRFLSVLKNALRAIGVIVFFILAFVGCLLVSLRNLIFGSYSVREIPEISKYLS